MDEEELVNIHGLARLTGLSFDWLKDEAKAGRIPCLRVGTKLRFSPSAVRAALAKMAANQTYEGEVFETVRAG